MPSPLTPDERSLIRDCLRVLILSGNDHRRSLILVRDLFLAGIDPVDRPHLPIVKEIKELEQEERSDRISDSLLQAAEALQERRYDEAIGFFRDADRLQALR